ncbi:non-ribosomal peptide synthetase [Amycolatopsis sp. cmx-4-61]|uniref:non-ribosomal peptide synthetase n=1 Tax=Amycolatopsis sp. cmx-4-61 TaxID=2790937 RepID=UPI00397D1F49
MTAADGPMLAAGTVTALRALAGRHGTTLPATLAAGVHAVLAWCAGDDVRTAVLHGGTAAVRCCPVDDERPFTALLDQVPAGAESAGAPHAVVVLDGECPPADPVIEFRHRGGGLDVLVHRRGKSGVDERTGDHVVALLTAVASDPDSPLWTHWPDAGEPSDRNDTARPCPAERTVADLFADRVRRHPGAPALRWLGKTLTYGGLDAAAERIAGQLAAAGVRHGDRVCLVAKPGTGATEALLAMARLGVCSVSLEPGVPPDRLRVILAGCRPRLVLTTDPELRPDTGGVPRYDLRTLHTAGTATGAAPAVRRAPRPEDPLCCVYTSGSTGRPKGVVLTHRGLVNLVSWHELTFGPVEGRRCAQLASLAFDASVWELWSTLCLGGCLCVADPSLRGDLRSLSRWITREALDTCFLPTVTGRRLLDSGALSGAQHLRCLLVGGDKLAAFPGDLPFTPVNVYGPTETSVFATWWRHDGSAPPPIGRPLSNTRAHVLDRHLRPVPAGRVGELYLAGAGLALGYLGAPGMTASRFVADPFGPPGTRMYRTGDRVSRSATGVLHFHGRADRQVKVRGTRVELDEIELVLAEHAQVAEAAVVCDGGTAGDPAIAAYCVTVTGEDLDVAALRAWLRDRLPAAMVPSRITRLPSMPRTPGGKTDRLALPAVPDVPPAPGEQPRTAAEESVQAQWAAVLGGRVVGIHENYFDVGGSSINLMELRWRLENLCGVPVPLARLFRYPTIVAMAELLEHSPAGAPGHDDIEL